MRSELVEINENVDPMAAPHKIEELYKYMIATRDRSFHKDMSNKINLPLLPSEDLKSLDKVCLFDMVNAAKILLDKNNFPGTFVPSLVLLYAGFVTYNKQQMSNKKYP